jgi:hypothetical protein
MNEQISITACTVGEIVLNPENNIFFHVGNYEGKCTKIVPCTLKRFQIFLDQLKNLGLLEKGTKVDGCPNTLKELYYELEPKMEELEGQEMYSRYVHHPSLYVAPPTPSKINALAQKSPGKNWLVSLCKALFGKRKQSKGAFTSTKPLNEGLV